MLVHAFLSGMGIALSYTLITILIVGSKSVTNLPLLFLITSALLLTKGYFYAHLEHSNQPQRLFSWVLISLFIWSFLMFLNLRISQTFLIIALAYCSYYVVYYLSNLEYWGTASLLFDVREGKRLFSLLSSGESVAKIIGYSLTPFVITNFSPAVVYLVVAICFAGSFIIFQRLVKRYKPSMSVVHQHSSHKVKNKTGTVLTILSIREIFKLDNFRRYISIFACLSTLTFFLLQYAFLLRVQAKFYDLGEIAVFFATLFSIAKILNLLIKVFISSRLCQFLGLKIVLLILPVGLLVATLVGIIGISTGQSEDIFIMWVFTAMIVMDEVFRTSLYTPAYLTLFQPLTKVKRLEGHTLTKAIMEPIGLGAAGLMIYALKYFDEFHLHTLTPIVLVLLSAWIFSGHRLFNAYLEILKNALKSKILKRGTLQLSKNEYNLLRYQKLGSKDPVERLYALQMLSESLDEEVKSDTLRSLLSEENPFIVKSALDVSSQYKTRNLADSILPLIQSEDEEISKKATYEYAHISRQKCIEYFQSFYEHCSDLRKSYIIGAAIKHGGLYGAINFGKELVGLIESENASDRELACRVISDISNKDYYHPLIHLLNDPDVNVRLAAIQTASVIQNEALLPQILHNRDNKILRSAIVNALADFGPELYHYAKLLLEKASKQEKIDLIALFDKNHSEAMSKLLIRYLGDDCFDVQLAAIKSLFNRSYVPSEDESMILKNFSKQLHESIRMLVRKFPTCDDESIRHLVYNEAYHIQLKALFHCLSFEYTRKLFRDVIDNCYSPLKANKTLALELLDNSLASKDKHTLVPLIESIFDIILHFDNYSDQDTEETDDLISEILEDGNSQFSSWITANFIRLSHSRKIEYLPGNGKHEGEITIIRQENLRIQKLTA